MTVEFYSADGKYLGRASGREANEISTGEMVSISFQGDPYQEWEVIAATEAYDGLRRVILTPALSMHFS